MAFWQYPETLNGGCFGVGHFASYIGWRVFAGDIFLYLSLDKLYTNHVYINIPSFNHKLTPRQKKNTAWPQNMKMCRVITFFIVNFR